MKFIDGAHSAALHRSSEDSAISEGDVRVPTAGGYVSEREIHAKDIKEFSHVRNDSHASFHIPCDGLSGTPFFTLISIYIRLLLNSTSKQFFLFRPSSRSS